MVDDIRIPFVLSSKNQKFNEPIEFEFTLTEFEKEQFKNRVYDFGKINIVETVTGNQDCFVISLTLDAEIDYIDCHDTDRIDELEVSNDTEVSILPNDDENSDLLPDKDGIYDLRPTILALLYSSIPNNYSEVENSDSDEFHIYSSEEYQKEKIKSNSPFASLDDLDLD